MANANGIGGDGAGIYTDGDGCLIEHNQVNGNDRGVEISGQRNCVIRNRLGQNNTTFQIVPGNTVGQLLNMINIASANTANDVANIWY